MCKSVHRSGFERIILLNGHGGNRSINQAVAIKLAEEDVFVLPITYWDKVAELLTHQSNTDGGSIGHAGERETSLPLYLRPDLVAVDRGKSDLEHPDLSAHTREFTSISERLKETSGGVHGDPSFASAEKGRMLFEAASDELIRVIYEYREIPVRHYREFVVEPD